MIDLHAVQDLIAQRLSAMQVKLSWKAPAMFWDKNLVYCVSVNTSRLDDKWDVFTTTETYFVIAMKPEVSKIRAVIAYRDPFTGELDRNRKNTPVEIEIIEESRMFQNIPLHIIYSVGAMN